MRSKSRVLSAKMTSLEEAAGIDLLSNVRKSSGRIDFDKYHADQENLASVNAEYKAIRDEVTALREKKWAKKKARQERARKLSVILFPIRNLTGLTVDEKIAVRVACELFWQCNPATIERAEKTARKEAAAETPPFPWPTRPRAARENSVTHVLVVKERQHQPAPGAEPDAH